MQFILQHCFHTVQTYRKATECEPIEICCWKKRHILSALPSISTYTFHKAWQSIMVHVFYNINKHEFNGSCYEYICFNLISIHRIILSKTYIFFVHLKFLILLQISSWTATSYWKHDAAQLLHQKLA